MKFKRSNHRLWIRGFSFCLLCIIFFILHGNVYASSGADAFLDVDCFKEYKKISEDLISRLPAMENVPFSVAELRQIDLPKNWWVDWTSVSAHTVFKKTEQGFVMESPDNPLRIVTDWNMILGNNVRLSLEISNISETTEAEIMLGYFDCNLLNYGEKIVKTYKLQPKETREISCDFSCMDSVGECRYLIGIQGKAVLQKFTVAKTRVSEVICVEGEITDRSVLPDPKTANYSECRFTARFEGNAILDGPLCHKELQLTFEGFRDRKYLKSATLKKGTKISCTLIPIDKLPKEKQSTEVADDLSLFTLDNYYVLAVKKISEFSTVPSLFSEPLKEYVSVFDRHINPPIPDIQKHEQRMQVEQELLRLNSILAGFPANTEKLNADFAKLWKTEKEKDAEGRNRIAQNGKIYVWRKCGESFWCLPEDYQLISNYQPISDEHISALLEFQRFLEANGVQLIVSVVPDAYDIAARVINSEIRAVPDYQTALVVKQLLENGIEAIYPSEAIIGYFNRHPFAFHYPADMHPADTAQEVLAELVAARLERFHLKKELAASKFTIEKSMQSWAMDTKFFWPENCDIGNYKPGEQRTCNMVMYDGKPVPRNEKSEILVIGNSFIVSPLKNKPSFAELLAKYVQNVPDYFAVHGQGPMVTCVERIFSQPEQFLKGKRVAVLQMGQIHFKKIVQWNHIEQMDRYRKMFVGKRSINSIVPDGSQNPPATDTIRWNKLTGAKFFVCQADSKIIVADLRADELDEKRPCICVVSMCAPLQSNAEITCNGISQKASESPPENPVWNNAVFDLPAGTHDIQISVSSSKQCTVAIQRITILQ